MRARAFGRPWHADVAKLREQVAELQKRLDELEVPEVDLTSNAVISKIFHRLSHLERRLPKRR